MRLFGRALASLTLLFIVLSGLSMPAASAGLTIATDYPGVVAKPGQSVDFTIRVENSGLAPGPVDLSVGDLPEGWKQPVLKGGNYTVRQVWVGEGKSNTVTLSVPVPDKAEGTYHLTVTGSLHGYEATLPLTLDVPRPTPAEARLTSQYPSQEGTAGTDFKFQVTLQNQGDAKQLFSLASKAPEGWQVTFHPAFDSKSIASLPVDGGSSQNIDVEIQSPDKVPEGKYTVSIGAGTGSLAAALDLQVSVVGKLSLALETPDGRLNATATAGSNSVLPLTVSNKGTAPIGKLSFAANAPPNWQVTFQPHSLDGLKPGESQQVQAVIRPADKSIAGDYVVSLSASAAGASDARDIRVAVQTSTAWGLVAVLIILAVVAGVWYVFKTYGRR